MNKEIILASASPRRKELLTQIGIAFPVFQEFLGDKQKKILVIGADTLVAFKGRVLGKPSDEKEADRMLTLLQGNTHQVYTGVTLVWQENDEDGKWITKSKSFVEKSSVSMYPMSKEEIMTYIATGEPMDKAGAYGIQGRCAAWIQGISGDYNNVVGLPVGRLYQELKKIENRKGMKEDD